METVIRRSFGTVDALKRGCKGLYRRSNTKRGITEEELKMISK